MFSFWLLFVTRYKIQETLSKDLKFSQHIAKKVNKANSMLALIKGTFEYLDNHSFLRLYTAIVRTHVEFANVVWHPYLRKDIESIERVQMRATKLVSNLKDLPYETKKDIVLTSEPVKDPKGILKVFI